MAAIPLHQALVDALTSAGVDSSALLDEIESQWLQQEEQAAEEAAAEEAAAHQAACASLGEAVVPQESVEDSMAADVHVEEVENVSSSRLLSSASGNGDGAGHELLDGADMLAAGEGWGLGEDDDFGVAGEDML